MVDKSRFLERSARPEQRIYEIEQQQWMELLIPVECAELEPMYPPTVRGHRTRPFRVIAIRRFRT
jgi:hypothetical protein